MSHDRGCPCGKEGQDEYNTCTRDRCFRAERSKGSEAIHRKVTSELSTLRKSIENSTGQWDLFRNAK